MNLSLLVLLLLLIPVIGAIVCAILPRTQSPRSVALMFSVGTMLVGVLVAIGYFRIAGDPALQQDPGQLQIKLAQLTYHGGGVEPIGFKFYLGANDAITVWLMLLTVGLMPLAVAASFGSIRDREKEYYAWMLALLAAMVGVFLARDVLLFYVFFELTLVPMFFIIGIWGGPERRYAAGKFFLFTFAGSVFTLAAVIYLGLKYGTFDMEQVVHGAQQGLGTVNALTQQERFWVLMGFIAGFAVKVPLFPVHTWLPLAHTEAPTAGSVILAGVLLKLGTYGLLRLAVPIGLITPDAPGGVAFPGVVWWIGVVCVVGVIYGALVAWVQHDIKKLVAYSSVSHLGFCVLGLVALNDIGMQGSVLYMINHGISTGALFLVIGMIYDRYHTRDINELSGLARRMPVLAFFFILFTLSSIGLPGTNGFVSEFLTILGAFTSDHLGIGFGAFAALGIILGAVYMLHMAARVIWGPLRTPEVHEAETATTAGGAKVYGTAGHTVGHTAHGVAHGQADQGQAAATERSRQGHGHGHPTPGDIRGREIAILVPLALAVIVLGVKPGIVMDPMLRDVQRIRMPSDSPASQLPPVAQQPPARAAEPVASTGGR